MATASFSCAPTAVTGALTPNTTVTATRTPSSLRTWCWFPARPTDKRTNGGSRRTRVVAELRIGIEPSGLARRAGRRPGLSRRRRGLVGGALLGLGRRLLGRHRRRCRLGSGRRAAELIGPLLGQAGPTGADLTDGP